MLVFNLFCLPVKLISLLSFNNYGIPPLLGLNSTTS